jgi:CheY-like chemotaxis protein
MKILVAEDDAITRELLKRVLMRLSDQVLEATTGVEALDLIDREDPDFLFTDIQMPQLDGIAVVEAVRASASHRNLPIVCLSGIKDRDEVTRLVELGIADYVLKPLRLSDAQERFGRVIEKHAGWRQRPGGQGQPTLFLVDPDPEFREFASPILVGEFVVRRIPSGARALRLYLESTPRPRVILVADGGGFVNAIQLAQFVTRMAEEAREPCPAFVLLSGGGELPPDAARYFDGIVQRTRDAEAFAQEVRRTVLPLVQPVATPT